MDDIQKMFQVIINGQSSFRQEMLKKFDQVENRFEDLESGLHKKIDNLEQHLTSRLDKIGKQLAYLEDDAPTREEFDKLDNRVNKLEHQKTSTIS